MFGLPTTRSALRPLAGDLRQLASVRRIVLDDGPERGIRALAFSTGGGLDFWVLADRSLDIGPLWFRGMQLAWQAPAGFPSPAFLNRLEDDGRGIERCFSGLMMTCGLEHLRKPEGSVLHGHLPFTPARVTACGEDWDRADPLLFCTGEMTQARVNGEAFRLHRRIEAPIGGTALRIIDRIENLSATPQPFGLMHHVNFGFPLVQDGARVDLDGTELLRLDLRNPASMPRCIPAGSGWRRCALRAPLEQATLGAALGFDATVLPFLQLWHNLAPGTRVMAIEPCTSELLPDAGSGPGPSLDPGAETEIRLELSFALG